jgi:hypothetical protein
MLSASPSLTFAFHYSTLQSFSAPINLSNDTGSAKYPNVQNSGENVYVSWTEESGGIEFRASSDGGLNWQPPLSSPALTISSPGGITQYPLMMDNGSNVYVVWSQGTESTNMQIYEATSTNYGQNFSAPVQLTSGYGGYITPVIASWGDDVYVGYIDNSYGRSAYVTCSADEGASGTWTKPFSIGDREPQLAAWGGQYVYAIADWNLFTSSNNCGSWTNNTPSTWTNQPVMLPKEPWIWAYGPNVYATWETGSSDSVVQISVSNNFGQTWSPTTTLSTTVPDSWAPMVWAYGNSAWIADRAHPGGPKGDLWVYSTTNGGLNWSSAVSLSGKGSPETFPYTVRSSDGEDVFVVWSHEVSTGYWTLMVSYSSNDGSSWTSAPGLNVSQNPNGEAGFENDIATASISSFEENCYAAWQFTNGTTNQIYFSYS